MNLKHLLMGALLASVASAHAAGNLVVNGDFEDPAYNGGWSYYGSITGWTPGVGQSIEVGAANIYGVNGFTQNVLELDSTGNSAVSQFVTLPHSGLYTLTFDYARRDGTSAATNIFKVSYGGTDLATLTPTSISATTASYTFYASNSGMLTFAGVGASDSYGGILDNVSMTAVPGPAAAVPMALGFVARMRRRRTAK